jgi:glycosyltransferase involved in cell wall biosynthesis
MRTPESPESTLAAEPAQGSPTTPESSREAGPRHVALLLNNPFTADSRSWKMATSLTAAGYLVTVIARAAADQPDRERRDGFEVVRVVQPRPLAWLPAPGLPSHGGERQVLSLGDRLRDTIGRGSQAVRYLRLAAAWSERIAEVVPPADIWQSEGLITLPVALRLRAKLGGRVVYDSRDLHVESVGFARLPRPWRRLLGNAERRWAQSADAVITVSQVYAEVLDAAIGRASTIVMNGPRAWERPAPPERLLHRRLGLSLDTRIVLYLGAVAPHRGIEQLIEAIGSVNNADLVIVGDGPLKAEMEAAAAESSHASRVHFLPAAPPAEILPLTASADVSAMPVVASTLNHRLNTPTKLFDAMGAGTPVVASDLPGMAPIVRDTGCGVLCDPTSPSDIARAIREIVDAPPERRVAMRAACLSAAKGQYAWERQADHLLRLYERLHD